MSRPRVGALTILAGVTALSAAPATATAEGTPPASVTFVSPTSATVGGTSVSVTLRAPSGDVPYLVQCTAIDDAPFAPSSWGSQAADGTITGTINVAHCANGSSLDFYFPSGSVPAPFSVLNPGVLSSIAETSSTFTPDDDGVTDTVVVHGDYVQGDSITVTVLDAKRHVVRTLTAQTWDQTHGIKSYEATWDGRNSTGHPAKPGTYTLQVVATTKDGGTGQPMSIPVTLTRNGKQRTGVDPTDEVVTFDQGSGRVYFQGWPSATTPVTVVDSTGAVVSSTVIGGHQFAGWADLSWQLPVDGNGARIPGNYTVVVTTATGNVARLPITVPAS